MSFSDVGSTMSTRPDRPLIVKATFDRYNKRITFSSARNCSYDLLRSKVEQSFSLQAFSFSIAYKDDDGEVTDITTDGDLTEAIQYFQAGVDDLPVSSAASILSGRSFGSRRITLKVFVTVDYDGPSLSDTSSLVSLEEYRNRNGSESSFSLSFSGSGASQMEPEDDSVTVSSRDTNGGMLMVDRKQATKTAGKSSSGGESGTTVHEMHDYQSVSAFESEANSRESFDNRYPTDPSAVFERLKLSDSSDSTERSTQWLRDQKTRNNINGIIPPESVSDGSSLVLEDDIDVHSPFDGDLALQQDNGKFYYTYTSGGSSASAASASAAGHDEADASVSDGDIRRFSEQSANMRWLASQETLIHPQAQQKQKQIQSQLQQPQPQPSKPYSHPGASGSSSSLRKPSMSSAASDPLPRSSGYIADDVPPEVLQFVTESPRPPAACTDCSSCGVKLDTLRYVCSTCGEKTPRVNVDLDVLSEMDLNVNGFGKGKVRDEPSSDASSSIDPFSDRYAYPPPAHRAGPSTSTVKPPKSRPSRPLPALPLSQKSYGTQPGSAASTTTLAADTGYELCPSCIETVGVVHASTACDYTTHSHEPSSPTDSPLTLSQLRRAAPRQKGKFRHSYLEKLWGPTGWREVEQNDLGECTICNSKLLDGQRYKCASCANFVLCRACYSQVHEIHPSHAFLDVPEKRSEADNPPLRSRSEPDLDLTSPMFGDDASEEDESLVHPGVKCAHCMLDIIGARFHCAICDSVDICQNCEAAGLPGNLDAPDGGHNSSHIMIKIPIPLNSTKVQTASRRARQLWQGRDAPNVQRSIADTLNDGDAVTVIGGGRSGARGNHSRGLSRSGEARSMNHHIKCKGCNQAIVGVRYQCACCPSADNKAYNLCANCEMRSYLLHEPMHIFFKLPRPVDKPIESQYPILPVLYKQQAGPRPGETLNSNHPRAYLSSLHHTAALCDHCMERISGEWFRCVYCAKDLCDVCEGLNAHNPTHFFYVFKAPVDMQMFRIVAELDNPSGSPPVLKYPVYYS